MARLVRLMRVCFRYCEPVALLRCSCWELAACRSWEYVVCGGANHVGRERSSNSRVDGRWVSEQAQRVEHLCSPTRESLRRASAAIPMGHLARVGTPGQQGNAQPYLLPAHCQSLISRHLGGRLRDIAALFAPTCPPGANLRSAAEPARRSLQLERRIHLLGAFEKKTGVALLLLAQTIAPPWAGSTRLGRGAMRIQRGARVCQSSGPYYWRPLVTCDAQGLPCRS